MFARLSTSSLIPLLLPIVFGATCFAKEDPSDDPFRATPQQKAKAVEKQTKKLPEDNSEPLTSFRKQLREIEATYAEMAATNDELLKVNKTLQEQNNLNKLHGAPDGEITDIFNALQSKIDTLKDELRNVTIQNQALKEMVAKLEKSEAEANRIAEEATEKRNMMHQQLFETLLYSDESSQQELAIKHLFDCSEKYVEPPIILSGTKMLRRICSLTQSESPRIKSLAARCLWHLHPGSARELGIQFGSKWRPLEYAKGSINTMRIYDALERPIDMAYDEVPLQEIVEEIQMQYGIGVRLSSDVAANQLVTYESINRPISQTLSGLLKPMKLGFAVVDDELRIMKESDPDLFVDATYNIAGLNSLAQVKTEDLLIALQKSFADQDVKFSKVGNSTILAKTTEETQRQIQEKIASLAPSRW